ncbi:MAG: tetratricopeptide repeat protein [Crocinitomicaceae bacterium]
MLKIYAALFLLLISSIGMAQITMTQAIQTKYEAEQYSEIITEFGRQADTLPAKAIYYIGMAYRMKGDDMNCLRYMILSINKDNRDPEPFYTKAMTFNYFNQFSSAVPDFEQAIQLDPSPSKYFAGLGDAYFGMNKYDEALKAYQTATTKENPIVWPYKMIPKVYLKMHQSDKALEAYYVAKTKFSKTSDAYQNVLLNIGELENLGGHYDQAIVALNELRRLKPTNYEAIPLLIQSYYGKKEYESAIPYRKMLHDAREKNFLEGSLKNSFCFDQFVYNGHTILAFESYDEGSKVPYYKHLFQVLNANGTIEYQIQTEFSPQSVAVGGTKYLLSLDKNETHTTFQIGFDDGFDYNDLKKAVIGVIEKN